MKQEPSVAKKAFSYGTPQPNVRKTPSHWETEFQIACVNWFCYQYSQYQKLLWGSQNAGKRGKVAAGKLKAAGLVAGIPDLQLNLPKRTAPGLFIELKMPGNTTTPAQDAMIDLLRQQGYWVYVVDKLEDFIQVVTEYMKLPDIQDTIAVLINPIKA